ncbi:CNH domain-containing protein [Thamnidium elegans]|uniref:Uncharacterized protein n=1 Tax=Thamnidium elegans TaxID=101142 RepID=A0A8H7SKQ2_9FUNG|nr:hypothetical protein INT48_001198 [Thamnidium elegans]KAI8076025.1 CNH domain-containing protein [Thamnidium elegans]
MTHHSREKSNLELLYKDLDMYMKELDSATTFDIQERNATEKLIPPFCFKVAGVPSEDSYNSSGMDTPALSRHDSLKSEVHSDLKREGSFKNNKIYINTSPIYFKLNNPDQDENNLAYMSTVSKGFISSIKSLCESRDIFCSTEYPNSFTGEEAVDILCNILPNDWTREDYKRMARSLMHSVPPLFTPVAYSDKSLKKNTFYDSSTEIYSLLENEISQGLFVPFLDCFTPSCIKGSSNGCYANICPNRGAQRLSKHSIVNKELQRNISLCSSNASSQDTFVSRCWSTTVSRETLQKTPTKEMKKQEAIYELIYTEEDYVRDLSLLDELFAKPLLSAQCIEPEKRKSFCRELFGNHSTIAQLHRDMYRELRDHQLNSIEDGNSGFVDDIGSIMLKYVNQFMDMYTEYGPHFVFAEYEAKQEMARNILFHNFIREKEKQAETRKLPFRHFIILPITRLQRYPLLLSAILNYTTDESEKERLIKCIETIRGVAKQMDTLTNETKQKLRVRQINDKIQFKPDYHPFDLNLLKPGRKLLYEGTLRRRSHLVVESVELYVFLFDHLLLMTKPKRNSNDSIECYMVSKNPVPLNLLIISDIAANFMFSSFRAAKGPAASNTTSLSLLPTPVTPTSATILSDPASQYINQSSLMIRHLGRFGGEYIVYTETPSSRYIWKEKIIRAQKNAISLQKSNHAFKVSNISDTTFAHSGTLHNYGRVTCTAPFVGSSGKKMVALGTQQGIWMAKEGDTSGFKKVLTTPDVTQIGVLEHQNILLVLADKILTAYSIAQLDPSQVYDPKPSKKSNTVSFRVISNHVSFFNTGTCNDRPLIITMRRRGTDSLFKAYEPTCGDLKDPRNSKILVSKTSFMTKPPAWFKVYKEFYIGTDASAVHFLKSKLLVACSRGFEVIDLERLSDINANIPDLRNRDYQFLVNSDAKPLGMFRCAENFLVCYDKFGFLMSTHGDYIKGRKRIEWTSNPQSVAFYYPYVIAFDTKFIEVIHAETGEVIQTIIGENTRYLPSSLNNTNAANLDIYCSSNHQFKPDYQNVFKLEPIL